MPAEMMGRRIQPTADGHVPPLERPGDYCGPVSGYCGENVLAVFYLLPVAGDEGSRPEAKMMRHIASPPHKITEEPDGTLTIRNSIGADPHWHGFLTNGRWELSPSKP